MCLLCRCRLTVLLRVGACGSTMAESSRPNNCGRILYSSSKLRSESTLSAPHAGRPLSPANNSRITHRDVFVPTGQLCIVAASEVKAIMKCQTAVSVQCVQCHCRVLSVRPRHLTPAKRLSNTTQFHGRRHTAADRLCPLRASRDGQHSRNRQKQTPQARFWQAMYRIHQRT